MIGVIGVIGGYIVMTFVLMVHYYLVVTININISLDAVLYVWQTMTPITQNNTFNWNFREVCKKGLTDMMKLIIKNNSNKKCEEVEWFDGLCGVCEGEHLDLIDFLVEHKKNNNCNNCMFIIDWKTALEAACYVGNIKSINYIIKRGDIVYDLDKGLISACAGGSVDAITLMLNLGAMDTDGGFIATCASGNISAVKLMAEHCGTIKHFTHASVIYNACERGNMDVIKYLVELGEYQSHSIYYTQLLERACLYGHLDVVKFMIDKGVTNFNEGLYTACCGGHIDIVNLLVGLTENIVDLNSGLQGACYGGRIEIIKLMIEQGATGINAAFESACDSGNIDSARYLLENCMYKSAALNRGFLYSCTFDTVNITNLVLKHSLPIFYVIDRVGINNSDIDPNEWMAAAASKNYTDIVRFMLQNYADNYNECMVIGCLNGNMNIINIMIENGANDWNNGMVAACTQGHINVINYMISLGATSFNGGLSEAFNNGKYDIAYMMILLGATNINYLCNTTNFRLYCIYSRHNGLGTKTNPKCVELLLRHRAYYFFRNRMNSPTMRKLPTELHRLIYRCLT